MKIRSIIFETLFLMLVTIPRLMAQDYEILFTKQINGNDNIYVINENGKLQQITNHPRKDSSPVISPDGNHIVFTSERVGWWKIWLLDIIKNEFRQLSHSGSAEYNPFWSPEGDHIIFVSSRDRNEEIYSMDKEGKNIKNLTKSSGNDNTPSWGKDNKIYFSSKIDGVFQIMRMNPDGSKKEKLSNGLGDKLMPQLSSDLKTILYYSDMDENFEIYTMSVNGSGNRRLTNHALMDIRPRWSPDSKRIVFERGDKRKNQHIYIMDSDGKNLKQLTYENYNYAPSFVPSIITLIGK